METDDTVVEDTSHVSIGNDFALEEFAEDVLKSIKEKDIGELINVIKDLNTHQTNIFTKHQKIAEHCMLDLLTVVINESETELFNILVWNLLSVICNSGVVRKTAWKELNIIPALSRSLKYAVASHNEKLQKICSNFLAALLLGAPSSVFQLAGECCVISLLLEIIESENYVEDTYKSAICCFSLLCDGTDICKRQLMELNVAGAVYKMGEKHALEDEDFCNLAAMTYDDLSALKIHGSIGRIRFLKGQVDEILYCSNAICLRPQKNIKYKKCSLCKLTFYCSKVCQVEHWKVIHHRTCPGKKKD